MVWLVDNWFSVTCFGVIFVGVGIRVAGFVGEPHKQGV